MNLQLPADDAKLFNTIITIALLAALIGSVHALNATNNELFLNLSSNTLDSSGQNYWIQTNTTGYYNYTPGCPNGNCLNYSNGTIEYQNSTPSPQGISNNFTISLWINPLETQTYQTIFLKGSRNNYPYQWIQLYYENNNIYLDSDSIPNSFNTGAINPGWQFLTISCNNDNNATAYLYQNGNEINSIPGLCKDTTTNNYLYLFNDQYNASALNAQIQDLTYYNTTLTQTDVQSLYAGQGNGPGIPDFKLYAPKIQNIQITPPPYTINETITITGLASMPSTAPSSIAGIFTQNNFNGTMINTTFNNAVGSWQGNTWAIPNPYPFSYQLQITSWNTMLYGIWANSTDGLYTFTGLTLLTVNTPTLQWTNLTISNYTPCTQTTATASWNDSTTPLSYYYCTIYALNATYNLTQINFPNSLTGTSTCTFQLDCNQTIDGLVITAVDSNGLTNQSSIGIPVTNNVIDTTTTTTQTTEPTPTTTTQTTPDTTTTTQTTIPENNTQQTITSTSTTTTTSGNTNFPIWILAALTLAIILLYIALSKAPVGGKRT